MIRTSFSHHIEPVIPPIDKSLLQKEIHSLTDSEVLNNLTDLTVYCTHAEKIPNILLEIGRLREIAFREIGEGSQRSIDIDQYDANHLHLFIWNKPKQEIVGAYRMGVSDHILKEKGPNGFYVSSLYSIAPDFFEQLGPSIELGRSIVRSEYQRTFLPLLMLITGILTWVARHPQYRNLFGLVSISPYYQYHSQQMMHTFLLNQLPHSYLKSFVQPRHLAPNDLFIPDFKIDQVQELINVIKQVENEERSLPALIKEYLKFDIRLISVGGHDPSFGSSLEYFCVTDLVTTHIDILNKYMGEDEAKKFLAFWNK